jgi:hypothetical protein
MDSPRFDWLRRAARSFLQGFIGMIVLLGFPIAQSVINAATNGQPIDLDFNAWKTVLIAGLFAGGMALVSLVQNFLEDKAGMPAVLKGQATSGQNPVPDPTPEVDWQNADTWPSTPVGASRTPNMPGNE